MKLVHKNLLYTGIITSILSILVLGYFVFMLPSLYVDYTATENYYAIVEQHNQYLEDGSYENVTITNPSCLSIEIPFLNDSIIVTGKTFQTTITPKTDDMKYLLSDIKNFMKNNVDSFQEEENKFDSEKMTEEFTKKSEEWKEMLVDQVSFLENMPFDIKTVSDLSFYDQYSEDDTKFYFLKDNTFILESGVYDGENYYTVYIGITMQTDKIVMSYLPAMTPRMNQITPIVMRSLPMLLAVIILFALIVSHLYSKGIVDPIIRLVKHTEAVKESGKIENAALPVKGKDEIAILTQTLNHLYVELDHNYKALESKNDELNEKNKSQEVFLRSSSHQLKTPISAALLLVDGMANGIGKYQETEVYLPEVKKQLLSMKRIVEEILSLSRSEANITMEKVDIGELFERQLSVYEIMLQEGSYQLKTRFDEGIVITTDANLLLKIFDNLLLNGIVHSKPGATILITINQNQFEIQNSDAHIPEELMPNIFEPFVSGSGNGHGLGLYIVNYYANLLGAKVEIVNTSQGVRTRVIFREK